nr:uncharacterized protein LOC109155154 [Ipomoea batatas]
MFTWQACNNTLPTASNLISRKNTFDDIYMGTNLDITTWLERNMEKLSTDCFGLLLTSCWMIWQERNNKVWNNGPSLPPRILVHAASFLSTWRSLQSSTHAPTAATSTTTWQPPPTGYLKVNVDAANDANSKSTRVACLVRDNEGSFHAALQLKFRGYHNAKIAEAIAIREALSWLKSRCMDNIQIESDALLVVEGIKNSNGCTYLDLILSDIRCLALNFHSLCFVFAKRSTNKAAHLLARDALLIADRKEWGVSPPSFLFDVLCTDLLY